MTKAARIRRKAKRTKRVDSKWGPEIARVVSVEQAKAAAVIEAMEAELKRVKKRKAELDAEWKATEGQRASDVIRGQWLFADEMVGYLQPKLDRLRRAAK